MKLIYVSNRKLFYFKRSLFKKKLIKIFSLVNSSVETFNRHKKNCNPFEFANQSGVVSGAASIEGSYPGANKRFKYEECNYDLTAVPKKVNFLSIYHRSIN